MTPRPYEIAARAVRAPTSRDLVLARRRGNSPSPLKDAMHNRFRLSSVSCALAAATVLAACSSPPKPIYQQEQFDATSSPYAHTFHAKSEAACEAARRSLLSQGYVVSSSRNDAVDGSKNFQPNNDMHVVIEFHVVCADANADGSSSIAYVNAVQDRYTLKKSNTSASVGLSVFGSLSLPIGSSDDALVKTASETIPAGVFYERFFNLVDHFLKIDPARRDRATVKAAEKEHVAPLPEPAPTPQGEPMKMTTPVVPTPPAAPVPLSGTGVAPGSGGRWGGGWVGRGRAECDARGDAGWRSGFGDWSSCGSGSGFCRWCRFGFRTCSGSGTCSGTCFGTCFGTRSGLRAGSLFDIRSGFGPRSSFDTRSGRGTCFAFTCFGVDSCSCSCFGTRTGFGVRSCFSPRPGFSYGIAASRCFGGSTRFGFGLRSCFSPRPGFSYCVAASRCFDRCTCFGFGVRSGRDALSGFTASTRDCFDFGSRFSCFGCGPCCGFCIGYGRITRFGSRPRFHGFVCAASCRCVGSGFRVGTHRHARHAGRFERSFGNVRSHGNGNHARRCGLRKQYVGVRTHRRSHSIVRADRGQRSAGQLTTRPSSTRAMRT